MDGRKLHKEQEFKLGRNHHRGKQNTRSGVDVDSDQRSQKHDSDKIGQEDGLRRNRQWNQIDVVTAVGKDCVPSPNGNRAGYRHRQHDEEVLVGQSRLQNIDIGDSLQPLRECPVLVQQQQRYETAGHGQQRQHQSDAEIESFGVGVSASAKDAGYEKFHQSQERALPVVFPPMLKDLEGRSHAAAPSRMTSTMSRATVRVSTSSTSCRNVFSSDWPRSRPMLATESCAITAPLRRIRTSEQTFSTTSSTCEQ